MSRSMSPTLAGLGFALLLLFAIGLPRTASAWKPRHHIYTGNEAIAMILAGKDSVWIDDRAYPVPPAVAQAIRNQPAYYRAGCIGPDGFPDLLFGQTLIHPDWKKDGGTYTWQWLKQVDMGGRSYYELHGGDATGQQGLAFAYGYLTHAAGDLWGHTFINQFAGGQWPELPGGDLSIAVRHIMVEGYVTERIPPSDMTVAVPYDFIYRTLINNRNSDRMARADDMKFGIPYFRKLRSSLQATHDGLSCHWYAPWEYLNCGMRAYLAAWIEDIDIGLKAWPERMARVGQHWLVDTYPGHMDDGMDDLKAFAYDHLLSMYGAPDFIGGFLSGWDALTNWVEGLIGINIPSVGDLVVYIVEQAYGIDFDSLKEYFTNPSNYIDVPPLFATDTSERLDALMHMRGASFDPDAFAAHKNTVITAKMVLLDAVGMDSLLAHYGAPPLYSDWSSSLPYEMHGNVMLGWIRSLDGDHQWRRTPYGQPDLQHSEGMPLWTDCSARTRVFRRLFTDWEQHPVAGNFPDLDEPCECQSDLPPTIVATVDRSVLWPPSHRMVTVTAGVRVEDDCDSSPGFTLLSIRSDDPDHGAGHRDPREDIQGAEYGTPDVQFQLRAERAGREDGRTYTITYVGTDASGKSDTVEVCVRVPVDMPGRVRARDGVAGGFEGPGPSGASFVLVVPSATLSESALPDVLALDASRAFLGNHLGQVAALSSRVLDVTGDGVDDVIVEYPLAATLDLMRRSAPDQEPVGFRYEDRAGAGYWVPDIAALGIVPGAEGLGGLAEGELDGIVPILRPTPNPFTISTSIGYIVPEAGAPVRFGIYDLAGREVRRLSEGFQPAGSHVVTWDGRGAAGARMSPGMYFVRGSVGARPMTWRVVLVP